MHFNLNHFCDNQAKVHFKLVNTAGTAGRACGLVEVAPGYEAGSRSVFSRAVVHDKLPRYDKAVSTKTYEYIASGIPVIASRTPGNQFIEDLGLGILIDPDNTKESVTAIEQAIPKCKEMSQKCLTMNFKWEEKMILLLYRGIK